MDAVGVSGEDLGGDAVFPDVLIRMLVVGNIVGGYGDQVRADVVRDVGSSPDKLPGLGAILSAMPAGVTKVEPHQNGLICLMSRD